MVDRKIMSFMNRRFGLKSHEGGEIGLTNDDSFMRLAKYRRFDGKLATFEAECELSRT